ncbi:MAG: histidine kinase [Archangium sp.]|nr:histidine kinase [Archangium sp.]
MRLVTRLTLAFLLVVILIITLHEYRQLGDRQADFERDMDRTHLLVASTLADAVELVAPREGLDAALKTVEVTNERHAGDVRVRWVCLDGRVDEPATAVDCATLAEDQPITASRATADGVRRFTLQPVRIDGRAAGAIEVSESPSHEGAWVRQHFDDAVLLALMTVAGMAMAAFVLGWWLVARPTRALMDKARAVGRGELKNDLKLAANDELSAVADEMNAMCRQLERAREETSREAAARLAAVEQLRHADRLATVGRLASGLAHELGTPLNVIEARAGLILEDANAEPQIQSSAKVIITCTEQVTKLVRQLLVFARPRHPELLPLKLSALASTVRELLEPIASKKQVAIEVKDAQSPAIALADEVLLQQALTNVVVNAVHACNTSGHVTISTGEVEGLKPGDSTPRKWCTVTVRDDGTGMAPDVRAAIFEPFFTTKPVTEGTGLGLPITVSILEDHHGFLTVESAPGKGSTFTLHLEPARITVS